MEVLKDLKDLKDRLDLLSPNAFRVVYKEYEGTSDVYTSLVGSVEERGSWTCGLIYDRNKIIIYTYVVAYSNHISNILCSVQKRKWTTSLLGCVDDQKFRDWQNKSLGG